MVLLIPNAIIKGATLAGMGYLCYSIFEYLLAFYSIT